MISDTNQIARPNSLIKYGAKVASKFRDIILHQYIAQLHWRS